MATTLNETRITFMCLVCGKDIEHDGGPTYRTTHIACVTCGVCGSTDVWLHSVESPATIECRSCARRAHYEERGRLAAEERARYETARALLVNGGGSEAEREAAIGVVEEYAGGDL